MDGIPLQNISTSERATPRELQITQALVPATAAASTPVTRPGSYKDLLNELRPVLIAAALYGVLSLPIVSRLFRQFVPATAKNRYIMLSAKIILFICLLFLMLKLLHYPKL